MLYTCRMRRSTPPDTRLFHAIVLVGAALGSATACAIDGACVTDGDASADAGADSQEPCSVNAPPNPLLSNDATNGDEPAPDVQAWPPTKC